MNCFRTKRVLALAVAASACGGNDDDAAFAELDTGALVVRVESSPPRLEIRDRAGDVVWATLPGAFAVRQARATYETQFGSFMIREPDPPPWTAVEQLAVRTTGDRIELRLVSDDQDLGTGTVGFDPADPRHVTMTLSATAANRVSVAAPCHDGEHFLGLGGQSFDVDHRGHTVPLWVQEDGIGKAPVADDNYGDVWFLTGRRHSTHTPMPVLTSSRGSTLAIETDARVVAAVCSEEPGALRLEAWEPELRLHVFVGPTPAASVSAFTRWIGRPPVPPRFAFAPWLDAIHGEANVRRVADALRAAGAAVSVIWTEDWRGGEDGTDYVLEEDWRVDRALYPGFETLAADLHGDGYKFLVYQNTFVDSAADVFAEAVSLGHTISRADGSPYLFIGGTIRDTTLLDLSSPDAVAWAKGVYREALTLGADGWMADFGEWLPTDAVLDSGESAETFHNRYPVEWARLNRELLDGMGDGVERVAFLRAAWLGSQPLVSVLWAGDQQTDFSVGDGMPSVIPMMIGLGMTGFPYVGHDIAGYMSRGTAFVDQELWFRWVTLGALSPVMRTHHGRSARQNWSWERDAASTEHLVRWSRVHMKLVPYLEAIAQRSHDTDGLGLVRPVALVWPDAGDWAWTATDQFVLGDRILVAPVLEQGATSRRVRLPPGTFYPLFGGPAVQGDLDVAAPLGDIPAFVAAGTVLVLYPDGVDTVVDAPSRPEVVTAAEVGGDRDVWLWPGGVATTQEGYAWTPRPVAAGVATTARWNDAAVEVVAGDSFVEVTIAGDGTLTFDGGGVLSISAGSGTRRVRLHAP